MVTGIVPDSLRVHFVVANRVTSPAAAPLSESGVGCEVTLTARIKSRISRLLSQTAALSSLDVPGVYPLSIAGVLLRRTSEPSPEFTIEPVAVSTRCWCSSRVSRALSLNAISWWKRAAARRAALLRRALPRVPATSTLSLSGATTPTTIPKRNSMPVGGHRTRTNFRSARGPLPRQCSPRPRSRGSRRRAKINPTMQH
jgi:hypothetical protein